MSPENISTPQNSNHEKDDLSLFDTGNHKVIESKRSKKKIAFIAGGALFAAGLAGGIGLAANAQGENLRPTPSESADTTPSSSPSETSDPTPEPITTTTPTPDTTPVPIETSAPSPDIDQTPEYTPDPETITRLESYDELTVDEFGSLTKEEQREWWYFKSTGLREYADGWYQHTGNPVDKLPETINRNSSVQDIAVNQAYQYRYILALEPEDRHKALRAVLELGLHSPARLTWESYYDDVPRAIKRPAVAAQAGAVSIGNFTEVSRQPDELLARSDNGHEMRYYYDEIVNPMTGKLEGNWYAQ